MFFRRTRHASKPCVVNPFFFTASRKRFPKILLLIETVGQLQRSNFFSHLQTAFFASASEINILQHFPYKICKNYWDFRREFSNNQGVNVPAVPRFETLSKEMFCESLDSVINFRETTSV